MNQIEQSILIVDDMPKNIQLLGSILKNELIDIEFATSGQEALEWLRAKKFDLVLLDIMMPEMDGFEVCSRIKQNPETEDIAVIFITAKTDIQSIIQGFELGAVDYLTKPFNKNELIARVKTHLTLQRQKKLLEQENDLKDKLFSIIGHDLRAPVGNIKAYIDAFLHSGFEISEETRALLNDLSALSEQAFTLLENLLFWAKNQSGKINCNPRRNNLNEIIENAILLIQHQAKKKSISIIRPDDKKAEAFFDAEQIAIVLRNLLSNAVKFTQLGGEIRIEIKPIKQDEKDYIRIEIADNGIGIIEEDLKRLFDKKTHFTTYGTNNEKGSGLGLHLCKEFVEMNGGAIGATSEPGKGSVFYFTVPL